ncbi:VIT domain-containing protein [Undibacterium flavidum]|uniref:DUF2135 domain-containing protein n=1 Tax=Undibacterium flavidum TaxID=2762297 RepID=A0ABR6YDP1_9BURK|nr:VIT domain-containing protein [Undibacterium flavidum]MBC3874664.1 DUF2135 domain-containing protein [Undibacterium flavidum]
MEQKTMRDLVVGALGFTLFVILSISCISTSRAQGEQNTPSPRKKITPPEAPPSIPHPPRTPIFPTLIRVAKAEQAIQLERLEINTVVAGSMAQSSVTMVFYNPNHRLLEGNLEFPLQDGQSITGFSLDINGKQRSAVPVEKAKGRQVFEEIQRRGIDPGLLEVTQGNNFKLRVYPLPALGKRTVEIQLAHVLQNKNGQWQLPFALASFKGAKSSRITIKSTSENAQAYATLGAKKWNFERKSREQVLQLDDQDLSQNSPLLIQVGDTQKTQSFIQEFQGQSYFLAELKLDNLIQARLLPKVIGLLWDSSGSGKNRDIQAELNELDLYFKAVTNAEVRLTRLRDRPDDTISFFVKDGNWVSLRKELERTIYDGASALGDWKVERQVEEYLFFSDGLLNYGENKYPTLNKDQRLFILSSASSTNSPSLVALAQQNGGRYIRVHREHAGRAAQELLHEGVRVLDAIGDNISDLQFESTSPSGKFLRISGILRAPTSTLNLRLMRQGKIIKLPFNINSNAPSSPLAAHLWARYRLQELEANPERHRGEIRRIGQQFSIPTSETSLIVLERADDYARHNITPPEELRKEVEQLQAQSEMGLSKQKQNKLESIVRQFQGKVTWWETDFSEKILAYKKSLAAMKDSVDAQRSAPSEVLTRTNNGFSRSEAAPVPEPQIRPIMLAERSPEPVAARSKITVTGSNIRASDQEVATPALSRNTQLSISMKKWTSDAAYIRRMKEADKANLYSIYLDEKPSYTNSSAFFLDAADILFEKGERDLALRVLSNLAEMELENRAILRILGYRLLEANAAEIALPIFEKITRIAQEEPQSFRDYGLALAANKQYQAAIDNLYQVAQGQWNGRFVDIESISLAEMNAIIAKAQAEDIKLNLSAIDTRLLKNLPLDIRVVMTWDADNSDMDLWVSDPLGEKCYFGHNATAQGGRMTRDATQGYGPEEFSLRKALPGKYKIETNFYGNRQQIIAGATTLQVKLILHFGTPKEQEKMLTLRLKDAGSTVFVGEFEVE